MEKLLRGVMKYNHTAKLGMERNFKIIEKNLHPKAVFFTCIDSRMLPCTFTQAEIGDMFVVRNAGNFIPHSSFCDHSPVTTEPAALELGCKVSGARHVVVCGHSDCKAINTLCSLRNAEDKNSLINGESPLKSWIIQRGLNTVKKFTELEESGFQRPLVFQGDSPLKFEAYIDPENRLCVEDKMSQVNALQQLSHAASYRFIRQDLTTGNVLSHALWYDLSNGDVHWFSRRESCFVAVNDKSIDKLLQEVCDLS